MEIRSVKFLQKSGLKKSFAGSPFLFGKVILTGESDPYWFFTGIYDIDVGVGGVSIDRNIPLTSRVRTSTHPQGFWGCQPSISLLSLMI